MFMQILSKFVKYVRSSISQNPEELLKIIKFYKTLVGVINDLKKKLVSEFIKL